ncbi:PRC-barrel domain-containing protein [Microvirga sp. Mcv34]|uniref:PRC-barrel domain-containing protein n=1 Tax=Microvirga sp. Mcv34 TaxID=2926016 RepID=UPI0021C983CA|nr:PRC-barrel domain-containing protein [Microvirga sp. Mcv34]
MLTSDLRGTTVYGANDEKIGDINDVLIDRGGRTVAVIVGVGGFLGIGQKDVAVPYQALEVMAENTTDRATSPVPTTAGNAERNMIGDPAATGSVNTAGPGTVNPSRIILRQMTKADLENAPNFNRTGIGIGSGTSPADGTNATANQ